MTNPYYFPNCFADTAKAGRAIEILPCDKAGFQDLKPELSPHAAAVCADHGFAGDDGQILPIYDENGLSYIFLGLGEALALRHGAQISRYLQSNLATKIKEEVSFFFREEEARPENLATLSLGWGLASIRTDVSKRDLALPRLGLSELIDQQEVRALIEGASIARGLVNMPANMLGPDEMIAVSKKLAADSGAKIKTFQDKELLKKNFPMIYAVGNSSHRRPALIDLRWGRKGAPKLTLVGKGVVFDTGGLDLKPPMYMRYMKKDMGGAAQALGLAWALEKSGLELDLRVLIPVVENAISSEAFRPGDVHQTRKGLSVEISDTDAEGRLILSDALTYACEEEPDLLIDFATLTGAARVALGTRIGALFGNNSTFTKSLQEHSIEVEDPLWTLPLWPEYREGLKSAYADIDNDPGGKGGAIYAALFLEKFVDPDVNWAHLDVYAWEDSGRPAFDKGGIDQGLRAVYTTVKEKFS